MKHQKKIKKIIPFIIASKQIKYSGTNLTKEMKNLYTENQKLLPNEIKEDSSQDCHFENFYPMIAVGNQISGFICLLKINGVIDLS